MLSGIVENLHKHKLNMTENLIEYNLPQAHNCKLLFTGRAIYWSQESQYNYKNAKQKPWAFNREYNYSMSRPIGGS